MKRHFLGFCLAAVLLIGVFCPLARAETPDFPAQALVLMEASTGQVLYEKSAHVQRPCASITKVMTLLLVFEAIDAGTLHLDDVLTASAHAAGMGGSDIWLKEGEQMTVDDLIKACVVMSANDAAVVLAEAVAGSEDAFVGRMNARALMQHEKIFDYTLIWIDYVRDGQTQLVNTNKLVRTYDGILGLKTGTTSAAGSCISAAAERNGMRLIAVVLGAENTKDRFSAASSLLDYGFVNWKLTTPELPELPELPVTGGMVSAVSLECEAPSGVLTASGDAEIGIKLILPENVPAPVEPGNVLGTAEVALNGDTVQSLKITAKTEAPAITFSSALQYFLACFFAA